MVQADCCSTLPRCQNLLVHRLAERRCADESGGAGDWRPEGYGRLGPIRCYARPTLSITLRPGGRVHGSGRRTVQAPSTWAPTRHRTNVWDYPGGARDPNRRTGRKPVALLVDALKDCSSPGDSALDTFGHSGTTMIAAERTGRCARLIEQDPRWCDVILRRWEELTKVPARLDESSATFAEVAKERLSDGTEGEN